MPAVSVDAVTVPETFVVDAFNVATLLVPETLVEDAFTVVRDAVEVAVRFPTVRFPIEATEATRVSMNELKDRTNEV